MKKYLVSFVILIILAPSLAKAVNLQTFKFTEQEVVVDRDTESVVSFKDYCAGLKPRGFTTVINSPIKYGACGQTLQVLEDYNISTETLPNITVEFKAAPFNCDTFNHGVIEVNGCYYYADKLLQINPKPVYYRENGTTGEYNFDWLLLHEIARVTGLRNDADVDQWAFAKIRERRSRLGLPPISDTGIIYKN